MLYLITAANAPTSLTASIIDSTSVSISWTAPVGGANGYIVVYNGNTKEVSSTEALLSGLSTVTVHNITVHAYKDIPSVASDTLSILLDGKSIHVQSTSLNLTPNNSSTRL